MMQKEESVNPRQQYSRVNEEVVKKLKWLQLTEVTYGKKTTTTNTNKKQTGASGGDSDPNERNSTSVDQLSSEKQATIIDPNSLKKYEVVQRTTFKAAAKPTLLPENIDKDTTLEGKGGTSEISSSFAPHQRHISAVDICCLIHRHHTIDAAEQSTLTGTTSSCTGEAATCNSTTTRPTKIRDTFLVVVSQYRPALDAFSLEMPAGLFDETDGTARKAAARELFEETGYVAFPEVLLWRDEEEEEQQKKRNSTSTGDVLLVSSAQREHSTCSSIFCERVPTPSPHHQSDAEHGPLSYDAGLSDDLFQLVTFEIDIHDDDDDKDRESSEKVDRCKYLTSSVEEEEVLLRAQRDEAARRMKLINKSPVPHLDVDEDITTHLLLLRRQVISNTSATVNTPPQPLTTTAARRLESIRKSVDSEAIVDGKLLSFVLGMDMANRWQGCCC